MSAVTTEDEWQHIADAPLGVRLGGVLVSFLGLAVPLLWTFNVEGNWRIFWAVLTALAALAGLARVAMATARPGPVPAWFRVLAAVRWFVRRTFRLPR